MLKEARSVDLVLALDPISVGIPARLFTWTHRLPLIVRLGGDYAWEQGRQRFGVSCNLDDFHLLDQIPVPLRIIRWLQSQIVLSADRVIAPSQYLKSIISKWGVNQDKIEVVHSVSYLKQIDRVKEKRSILDKQYVDCLPVLFSVARLVPWKGFETLIDVVADLKQKYPKILLLIGGDGPLYSVLQKQIDTLQLNKNVKLLGLLDRKEIELLSQHVNVFVLNTEYEGFSHQLVECMALSMPIITTDVGGNSELVQHGRNGILIDYNNKEQIRKAVIELTESESARKLFIANAHDRLTDFTKEKSIGKLNKIIRDVIEKTYERPFYWLWATFVRQR